MINNEIELINEQNLTLKEILKWVRFLGSGKVKNILTDVLSNDNLRLAYQLSDGVNTSTLISKETSITQPQVTRLWKHWAALGIGETLTVSGGARFRRSFDLKLFGIPYTEKQMKTKNRTDMQALDQPIREYVAETNSSGDITL